jgi:phage FluMu gp28-like protein
MKLVSDNAWIGRHPTTILGEKLGEHVVVAFDPTLHSKGEMCTKVKRYFQNQWIRMPYVKHIQDDFLSIDRIITPSNNIVYHASRSGNIGHGDMFSAFAQALTEVNETSRCEIKGVSSEDPAAALLEMRDRVERNRQRDTRDRQRIAY